MCINTHCTPFKITKYYTTIKVKARVQPLKKLKSQSINHRRFFHGKEKRNLQSKTIK